MRSSGIKVASVLGVVLAVALLAGCGKDNRKATGRCANAVTSQSCNSCCRANGAFSSVSTNFGNNPTCTCKGRR